MQNMQYRTLVSFGKCCRSIPTVRVMEAEELYELVTVIIQEAEG